MAVAGPGAVHTGVRTARCSQSDGGAAGPLEGDYQATSVLTPAEGLLLALARACPTSRHLSGDWDVSPLGLAWRGPAGLPTVSLSRRCPSCPLRFVLGLESTTRIPKLGELGHQRCKASFRYDVQPGA
jgi:hypothetical protein